MIALRAFTPHLTGRRTLLTVAYTLALLSCGDPLGPAREQVARIVMTPSALALSVGVARAVVAIAVDEAGAKISDARIFWSTEDPLVATVSQTGVVTGMAPGSTRVAASSKGTSAIVAVAVASLPVALVRVTPSTTTLRVGSTVALTADAQNSAGTPVTGRPVTWSSGTPSVATVSAAGVVTGITRGVATISATIDGATGSALVTIEAVPVARVRVSPDSGSMLVGQTLQLSATPEDSAGVSLAGRATSWATSAPAIATVSSTGIVNALSPGIATITAISEGKSGTARITVSRVPVDAVVIAPSSATTTIGRTVQLTARALDSAGGELTGRALSWSSDQPGVATVSLTGLVTAVSQGRALVLAASEGRVGSATIDVTPVPVASLVVAPASIALVVGSAQQLIATPMDAQGTALPGRVVTWISGAPSIASVSPNGLVTAIGVGTAPIIATCEGQQATVTLTTTLAPVATVTVTPQTASLNPDSALLFSAAARDANGNLLSGRTTSWSTSNSGVATVAANGLVTGVAVGSARISATTEGIVGAGTVTVSLVPIARVTVVPNPASLVEGQAQTFSAVVADSNGNPLTGRALAWTSSTTAVATVTGGGVVTAVAPGSATITASAPNAGLGGTTPSGSASVVVTYAAVAAVSIVPAAPTVTVGTPTQLTATLQSAPPVVALDATGRTLAWSVADPTIATVSATGMVTGVVPGTTTVTLAASSPGQATPVSTTVTLTVSLVPIARIVVAPVAGTVHVGTLYARQLSAQAFDASNNPLVGRTMSWTTSDASRLTVTPAQSGTGVTTITALNTPGTGLLVIASAPGATGVVSDTLTIDSDLVPVSSVSVSPTSGTLNPQQTQALAATAIDSAGAAIGTSGGNPLGARTATWTSADAAIGTVSAAGVVTAVGSGSTSIGVTVGGAPSATFALTVVLVPVTAVSVSAPITALTIGNSTQATVIARDNAGNALSLAGRTVSWTSASTSIASVSSSGVVTAVGAGNTVISVTVDGVGPATLAVSVTAPVVVPIPVASVSITAPDSSLTIGTGVQAAVVARDATGNILLLAGRTVVWSSGATSVATVSVAGLITAAGAGSTTIDVTVDGVGPATIPLTVSAVPVASVGVTAPDSSLTIGDLVQATVVARDAANNALSLAGRTVAWTSSATSVATISSAGLITAIGVGSATIGVTVDGVGPATIPISVALVPVASVSLLPVAPQLIVGSSTTVVATPRDSAGNALTNRTITWSVSNAKASINAASGGSTSLTALDSGTVVLTASSGGKSGGSTASISLVPVDTVEALPASSAPSISLRAGAGRNSTETFRAVSNTAGNLSGRAFSVTVNNSTLAFAVAIPPTITDKRGKGDFEVTLTAAAKPGDSFTVTVTIEGKSTVWQATVR